MAAQFTGTLAMNAVDKAIDYAKTCVQPKYDGVRCQMLPMHEAANAVDKRLGRSVQTQTCTRSGNYVPNDYARSLLDTLPVGLDGELVAAADSASGEAQFGDTMSALSRKDGKPSFKYIVYDYCLFDDYDEICSDFASLPYSERMGFAYADCKEHFGEQLPVWLAFAPCDVVPESRTHMNVLVEALVAQGYEGAILRRLDLPHVSGRSKQKLPAVMRIKAWADVEAEIVGVIAETWHDCETNRKQRPELIGTSKDFASSFECKGRPGTPFDGQTFRAPLSVSDAVAREYLANAKDMVGKLAKVRYLAAGVVDKPRLPVCVGVRESYDVSEQGSQE